ncbi:MAG: 1-acyl-sn-glycerol-3-phosphate acyltransferase, partial [Gammaproteobacteria bacterium]
AALRQILRTGSARLESGLGVIIVPEATRVRLGERRRDEPGGHAGGAQRVSGRTRGAQRRPFLAAPEFDQYPGTIDVVIGPLIDPAGKSATEITAIAEHWIEATCERLGTSPEHHG